MIENMTAATRARIAKQKQSKQILQWKTDAMRSISDLLVGFRNKYTSFTSPKTNLLSSSFFSRNLINVISEKNSKYIKATGTSNAASSMSILGVKQMATTTTMNIGSASDKTMETGEIDLSGNTDVGISTIAGILLIAAKNIKQCKMWLTQSINNLMIIKFMWKLLYLQMEN